MMFATLRMKSLLPAALLSLLVLPAIAADYIEQPFFAEKVAKNEMPPVSARVPRTPLVSEQANGEYGGDVITLISRARDIRYLTTYGYTRLVGYDRNLQLQPDLLEKFEDEDDRIFTFTIRAGHRWSDGSPFTAEDFRYYWEEIAQNKELSPSGVPEFMMVDGKPARFEIIDERTVRYTFDKPNPRFLPHLAGPIDPGIYRPAHYLKQFHAKYADKAKLDATAKAQKLKSWAALHNRLDDMKEHTNPDEPVLQAWHVVTKAPANRFVFERNPYYHRVDAHGHQLPYIDRIIMDVSAPGLFAAKANAGEVDLLFRGISMSDIPVLKQGEKVHDYTTLLWPYARGSELALYPNLNTKDPVWRTLNRDIRYRRALSLGIDRRTLNNALLFGLGIEGNNTIMEQSPLFFPGLRTLNATYDPTEASRLLDEIGLSKRNAAGIRLLPDGRELEIIVETDGESTSIVDGLTLIGEFWREIGVKLFVKPQDRTVLRNRAFAGLTTMVASQGFDNAIPTAIMPPTEYAPMRQDNYSWPDWGQYVETKGKTGAPVDLHEAKRLLSLYDIWMNTANEDVKRDVWTEMLRNHAENQWSIGTVAGALQPIVVRNGLEGLPKKALYSWEPTAMVGIYRIDEMHWNKAALKEARR